MDDFCQSYNPIDLFSDKYC